MNRNDLVLLLSIILARQTVGTLLLASTSSPPVRRRGALNLNDY
jgi:hypothetical protein